ncbi:MAG: sigma factor-like helix-turn-helix DNA-binding protein [Reyranella sp.]|nr:sigma factor-like helix-turn-helix DNA-binding protein [Reyranella sp.]
MARPLSKKNEQGVLTRPEGIEGKINIALTQDWATLSRRVRETNPQSRDFLPSECLVHLIRDAIHRGEERVARVLMPQLLKRAEANLERTVPDSRMRDAESVRHTILSDLMMMFTQDGTEGHEAELDFYECKFLRALRFLRIDHVRKALSERKELTDLPQAGDGAGEAAFNDEMLARLSRMASIGPSQEDALYLPEVIAALDRLPPDQKRAVILRRIIGHTEEETAKIMKVKGRTVRNRLSRADKQLKTLKEDL